MNLVFAFRSIKRIPSYHLHLHRGLLHWTLPSEMSILLGGCSRVAGSLSFRNEVRTVHALSCTDRTLDSGQRTVLLQCPVAGYAQRGVRTSWYRGLERGC